MDELNGPRSATIAGAGIAGLAAAIALAKSGWRVRVQDQVADPSPVGAGLLVQPTGLAALDRIGLGDAVRAMGAPVNRLLGTRPDARAVLDISYDEIAPAPSGIGIHRGGLHALLLGAARETGAEIVTGRAVTELDPDADLNLIADGHGSQLRRVLGEPKVEAPYPWGAVWAIVPDPDETFGRTLRQVYDGPSVMIGALPTGLDPVSGTRCVTIFWSLPVGTFDAFRQRGLTAWKDEVSALLPALAPLLGAIEDIEQLRFATYGDVVMRSWHRGNAVAIGDAAHAMSPQLGQGANLALIDAVVLARCLEEADSIESGLATYSAARRAHLRYYQAASRWLTPFYQSGMRWLGPPRDLLMPLLRAVPYTRRQMVLTMAGMKTGLFSSVADPADLL